jgi:hypothetical protein
MQKVQQKCSLKPSIHYKHIKFDYKLTIGAEKPVDYKRVLTITSLTIKGIDCIVLDKSNIKAGIGNKSNIEAQMHYRNLSILW